MKVKISFKETPANVRNIKVIGSFDYSLEDVLQIEMIGLIYVDIDTPSGASQVYTYGDLRLE